MLPELTQKELGSTDFPGSFKIPGTDAAIRFGGQIRTILVRTSARSVPRIASSHRPSRSRERPKRRNHPGRRYRQSEPVRNGLPHADGSRAAPRLSVRRLRRQQSQLPPAARVRAMARLAGRPDLVGLLGSRGGARRPGLRGPERHLAVPPARYPLDLPFKDSYGAGAGDRESVRRPHRRLGRQPRCPTSSRAVRFNTDENPRAVACCFAAGATCRPRC